MELFPHILIRMSGGPFEHLESLDLLESVCTSEQLFQIKTRLEDIKTRISDRLFELIPGIEDSKVQKNVLKCRRDIFNGKEIKSRVLEAVVDHLPEELMAEIEGYLKILGEYDMLKAKGSELYSSEMSRVRANLHNLAREDTLQKGLLLSSQSLLNRIPDYIRRTKDSGPDLNKKDSQTERGLIKYMSRLYGKTSPFSTFTNLVMGTGQQAEAGNEEHAPFLWLEKGEEGKTVYHIRLNNFLYGYLKAVLCKIPEIYRYFPVRPNPTLKQEESHFLFLTNNDNIEAFQRIPLNPVLDVFLYLSRENKEGIGLKAMIDNIIENEYIDAPAEDLEAYVYQLIEYGFMEFNIGVSGIDPDWDVKLKAVIKKITTGHPIPLLEELADTLDVIRDMAAQYGDAPVEKRNGILEEAYNRFRTTCMKLHEKAGLPEDERKTPEEREKEMREKQKEAAKKREEKEAEEKKENVAPEEPASADDKKEGTSEEKDEEEATFKHKSNTFFSFKPEQMFYEDTTVNITPRVNEKELAEFTEILNDMLQKMKRYEGIRDENERMRHFFIQHYGSDQTVQLLTFYEDFYREFKKPEAEFQRKREHVPNLRQYVQELEKQVKDGDLPEEDKKKTEELATEKKAELEKLVNELDEAAKIFTIPTVAESQKENKAWQEELTALLKQTETVRSGLYRIGHPVNITPSAVEASLEKHPYTDRDATRHRNSSFGSFIQFYRESTGERKGRLMGVLNSSFPGFGKLFSRFLHIFDDQKTDDMRKWNNALPLDGDPLLVEDCDASYFNANLHPPLLPYEVRIPGGHNSLGSDKQIPITELQVRVHPGGGRLVLVHEPTGKRVYVNDLGFQGHKGRSQLFQLLEKFTLARYLFAMPLTGAVSLALEGEDNEKEQADGNKLPEGVRVSPRVLYDGRIVIQRQSWTVNLELLPIKQSQETSWEYFLRVDHWRRELGLPDEVFVHVVDRMASRQGANAGAAPKIKPKARPTRDDYKPQFISFKNPFLVNLLEKLINRVTRSLRFVEMLPASENLLKVGETRHITEFTLQWYTDIDKTKLASINPNKSG